MSTQQSVGQVSFTPREVGYDFLCNINQKIYGPVVEKLQWNETLKIRDHARIPTRISPVAFISGWPANLTAAYMEAFEFDNDRQPSTGMKSNLPYLN